MRLILDVTTSMVSFTTTRVSDASGTKYTYPTLPNQSYTIRISEIGMDFNVPQYVRDPVSNQYRAAALEWLYPFGTDMDTRSHLAYEPRPGLATGTQTSSNWFATPSVTYHFEDDGPIGLLPGYTSAGSMARTQTFQQTFDPQFNQAGYSTTSTNYVDNALSHYSVAYQISGSYSNLPTTPTPIGPKDEKKAVLFNDEANGVNFTSLTAEQTKALTQGADRYNAAGANDTVVLPNKATSLPGGWDFKKKFYGGQGNDSITGGDGDDIIDGGDGDDVIVGGAGKNTFIGSAGNDRITGGSDVDVFDFRSNGFAGFATGTVQSLDGGAAIDTISLPGNRSDYKFVVGPGANAGSPSTSIQSLSGSLVKLSVQNIERVEDSGTYLNKVNDGFLVTEAIKSAVDAYTLSLQTAELRGWRALSAIELGINAVGTEGGRFYSLVEGVFTSGDATALLRVGNLNGRVTLSVSFTGTDSPFDVKSFENFDTHYKGFQSLVSALPVFVKDAGIQQVLIDGHSLGGAMTQLLEASLFGKLSVPVLGYTIGSPGAAAGGISPIKLINFVHDNDPIARVPEIYAISRGGETVIIDSGVSTASLILSPKASHQADLYLTHISDLQNFATDSTSLFARDPLAKAMATNGVYTSKLDHDLRINVGSSAADVVTLADHDYILGGGGADTVNFTFTSSTLTKVLHKIDGGSGVDRLVLSGASGNDVSLKTLGNDQFLIYKGAVFAELRSVEEVYLNDVRLFPSGGLQPPSGASKIGTQSADKFVSNGNQKFDGGEGLDTVIYHGSASGFAIKSIGSETHVIESKSHDVVSNIERLVFDDQVVALDIQGNAGNAYRLYQAAFDRMPDVSGLSYWTNHLDTGRLSLEQVASYFTSSAEFKSVYGEKPAAERVVDLYYHNVLGRAGETDGFNYWVGVLNRGIPVSDVLNGFANSAENHSRVDPIIAQGIVLDRDAVFA